MTGPKAHPDARELYLLYEISRALDGSLDLRDVVGPVLRLMADHMGMVRGTLTLLDRETRELWVESAYGLSDSQKMRGRYRVGEGVTGKVVETGRPVVVPRISEDPLFLNRTGARKGLRKSDISFLCVPIKSGNEVIGALSADRLFEEDIEYSEDVRLLSIIASMIAQAVGLRRAAMEERSRLEAENLRLQEALAERFRPSNIIGDSPAMRAVYDMIAQVSRSDATVLIRGESGVGKELVANAIHYNSPRATEPFIRVNCAALPETVIESELFGHEQGAFTGAVARRKGRFELAHGGTLFLDEIGDFSPATQVRLLRVLQEREFERVGGSETVRTNVRVIAATNRELEALMAEGEFRQDLYYRLNVFPIYVPPLRDRRTDIPLLANHFIEKSNEANSTSIRRISAPALEMLMAYFWPGNARELENCIERAALLATEEIHAHHLPPTLQSPGNAPSPVGTVEMGETLETTLENVERELILEALRASRGNMAKAARSLGISERVMGLRVKKHSIDWRALRQGG